MSSLLANSDELLLNFLKQKSENLPLDQLIQEFREKTGSSESIESLNQRITNFLQQITKNKEIDVETKMKIKFALGAPLDSELLVQILKKSEIPVAEPFLVEARSKILDQIVEKIGDPLAAEAFLDDVNSSDAKSTTTRTRSEMMHFDEEKRRKRCSELSEVDNYSEESAFNENQRKSGRISKKTHLDSNFVYTKVEKCRRVVALENVEEIKSVEPEIEEEDSEDIVTIRTRSGRRYKKSYFKEEEEPEAVDTSEVISEENERKEDSEEVPSQEEDQDSDDSFIDVATVNPEDQFYEIEDVQEDSGSDNDSTQDLNESLIGAITVDHPEDDSESEAPPTTEEVQVFAVPRIPKNRRAIFRSAQGSFPKRIQKTPEDPPCSTKLINESAIPDVSKRVHPKFRSMSVAEIERPIQNIQKPSLPISTPLPYLSDTPISHRTHQSLLTSLQSMMITLDIPIPRSMEDRIQRNIKMDDLKNKISLAELQLSIKSCFLILGRCSNSEEATISLKDFILLFRNMLITLQVPFLSDFENTLKTIFGSSSDKKVSVEKLQSALDAIISVVAP